MASMSGSQIVNQFHWIESSVAAASGKLWNIKQRNEYNAKLFLIVLLHKFVRNEGNILEAGLVRYENLLANRLIFNFYYFRLCSIEMGFKINAVELIFVNKNKNMSADSKLECEMVQIEWRAQKLCSL